MKKLFKILKINEKIKFEGEWTKFRPKFCLLSKKFSLALYLSNDDWPWLMINNCSIGEGDSVNFQPKHLVRTNFLFPFFLFAFYKIEHSRKLAQVLTEDIFAKTSLKGLFFLLSTLQIIVRLMIVSAQFVQKGEPYPERPSNYFWKLSKVKIWPEIKMQSSA